MILVIIAVLMAVTNTLTRTELDITVTMREKYATLMTIRCRRLTVRLGISCCYNSLAALFSNGCTASGVLAHVTICVVLHISYSVTMLYMNNSYDIEEVTLQLVVEIT